jgi:hypothetical protein
MLPWNGLAQATDLVSSGVSTGAIGWAAADCSSHRE